MQVYMFASFYYSSKAELNRIWVNGIKENLQAIVLINFLSQSVIVLVDSIQ